MIWWLITGVIGVLGVANAILSRLRKTAARERQRWEDEYKNVEQQIHQYDQQIQQKIRSAQSSTDFHVLTNLHFESQKVADHAKDLLDDAKKAVRAIGNSIYEIGKEKSRLIAQKRSTWNRAKANELEQEISALVELNRRLFNDKAQLETQRDSFGNQVTEFNMRTHSLKLSIRDRCGTKGQDWYKRLEKRTEVRKVNRERAKMGLAPLPMPDSKPLLPKPQPKIMGTVKWFNKDKEFGFITPDDGKQDLHVHLNNLIGIKTIKENDRVEFIRMKGEKGPWAKEVRKI